MCAAARLFVFKSKWAAGQRLPKFNQNHTLMLSFNFNVDVATTHYTDNVISITHGPCATQNSSPGLTMSELQPQTTVKTTVKTHS